MKNIIRAKSLSEDDTLDLVLSGSSIARYGDGELKLAVGASIKSQPANPVLAKMLRTALLQPDAVLVGVPFANPQSPKFKYWKQFEERKYNSLYSPAVAYYASAFITRPDSAPWINRPDYWKKVRSLWEGKDVVLVRGSTKSLTADMLRGSTSVEEVCAPIHDAFAEFHRLFDRLRNERRRVLLCLGPTATALAWTLGNAGVQAVDLGHIGMFLRRTNDAGTVGLDYPK